MSTEFVEWLAQLIRSGEVPKHIMESPGHLEIIPLALSPLFNQEACDHLMKSYRRLSFIDTDYDGTTKVIAWNGPPRVHVKNSICGYSRAIYAKMCKIGIPAGYSVYTKSGNPHDINPMNTMLKPDIEGRAVKLDSTYFPFTEQNRSGQLGIFGVRSIQSVINAMEQDKERDPVVRLQHLISLSSYTITREDKLVTVDSLRPVGNLVYASHAEIRDRVAENSKNTNHKESELLDNCIQHIDSNKYDMILTRPIRLPGKVQRMHHIMWQAIFGNPDFSDLNIVRPCKNKNCLNPFHYKHE